MHRGTGNGTLNARPIRKTLLFSARAQLFLSVYWADVFNEHEVIWTFIFPVDWPSIP